MNDQAIVQRADLQKKDKSELSTIVEALGGKVNSRSTKATLADQILELSGVVVEAEEASAAKAPDASAEAAAPEPDQSASTDKSESPARAASAEDTKPRRSQQPRTSRESGGRGKQDNNKGGRGQGRGRAGEPPAEWETELESDTPQSGGQQSGNQQGRGNQNQPKAKKNQGGGKANNGGNQPQGGNNNGGNNNAGNNNAGNNNAGNNNASQAGEDEEGGNRRRRRRGRGRDRDDEGPAQLEPIEVSGFLELRDDGYGFLRVDGWTQSKDDVYVPVKMVRQLSLRRGDHITGTARPATRNEKNPAMDSVALVNGADAAKAKDRPHFDELTPLFSTERLRLELAGQPEQLTPRVVDLVAPIGKGQRGLVASPPKAGKTTLLTKLARSIETNNPEVNLVMLLIDERPEEVTEIERSLEESEVVASTFDRPPEEHIALAELTIERAKRLVETGEDVVIILDGLTRLTKAYNMAGQTSGRLMVGGLDTAAVYPPKRFFGSARNIEDGGSLTIIATLAVETGSTMDEVIFEEFTGTGNMELRLDRGLAENGMFPAIDLAASSTRRDELLFDQTEGEKAAGLRRELVSAAEANGGSALGLLVERLKNSASNEAFLGEIVS